MESNNKKSNSVEELSRLLNIPISVSQAIKNWIDEKEMIVNKLTEELQSILAQKDKEIEALTKVTQNHINNQDKLILELQSELNSLKEKQNKITYTDEYGSNLLRRYNADKSIEKK